MTDPTPITPDEAIAELVDTAETFDRLARDGVKKQRENWARKAAAIRWILTLTAYGVDHDEITI